MDIQVTFEDGTTETRPAWSPCIADVFEPNLRHPSEERWYQYLPDERLPLLFCGRSVRPLSGWRGGEALVWRITGQDDITKALTGEWQSCRVETADAQIERLTRERDAARRAALLWKGFAREFWKEAQEAWGVFRRLRDAARGACDREMGDGHRYPEGVKVSTLVAHLNTMHTATRGDLINARARAGAARVEAEQAVERARVVLKHAHGRARIAAAREALAAAEKRRTQACEAYGAARAAEQAAS